jgi:DNA repair exonuclease SbcCD ATPase subunit
MRQIWLKSLALSNFRSFRSVQLTFPSTPGITFIFGPNGAGKSSLVDAVSYTAFGASVEGLKGPDLVSTDFPKTPVRTSMEIDVGSVGEIPAGISNDSITLERTWDKGHLNLTPGNAPAIVGMTKEQFFASVLFGQGRPLFIDLDPAARLEIFEVLLNLQVYGEAAERALTYQRAVEGHTVKVGMLEAKADGMLAAVVTNATARTDLADLTDEFKSLKEQVAQFNLELAKTKKTNDWDRKNLQARYDEIGSEIKSVREGEQVVVRASNRVSGLLIERTQLINRNTEDQASLGSVRKAICESCGQKLPERLVQSRIEKLDQQIIDREKKIDKLDEEIKDLNITVFEVKAELPDISDLVREYDTISQQLANIVQEERLAQRDFGALQQQVKSTEAEIEKAKNRVKLLETQQQALIETKQLVGKEMAVLKTESDTAKQLKNDFRAMRLMVVEEILEYLNAEANLLLSRFGMPDYKITFATQEVGKGGTSKPSLSATVDIKGTKLPFHAYSGGERQRLRIVSALGQANVIQSLSGVEYKFEIWDEPSSWLSQDGVQVLVDILQERAQTYGKRIILIDHRVLDSAAFDQVIEMGKKNGVSSIIQQQVFTGE